MAIEIIFEQERDTKNTVRYKEMQVDGVDAELAVGTLYVQKVVLGSPPPEKLKVIIEEA